MDEEIQEEPLFSAGEEENNQDPEEYKIWFENLRDDEYSTYFFDNENGELRLNTENLNGKNASISWEVGSRTNDPGGLGNDEFTTDTGLHRCFSSRDAGRTKLSSHCFSAYYCRMPATVVPE